MNNYFWDDDIKVTPTSFFYEYQEMFKVYRYISEKIDEIVELIIKKHDKRIVECKYEMYTQNRRDVLYDYYEQGFIDRETNIKVAGVLLTKEHFDWKDFTHEKQYWIESWVCDELKEFIGGKCE